MVPPPNTKETQCMKIRDDKKCSKEVCLGNFSTTSNNLCVSALFDCFGLLFFECEIFRLLGVSFIGGGVPYSDIPGEIC